MLAAAFVLSIAALSPSSLPSASTATTAAERLATELSKDRVAYVVDDAEADTARCHANRLVLTAAALQTLAKATKPEALPATLTLSATRHGVDAKQRRCTAPTTITVEASARRPLPPTGTSITVAVVGQGFSIDAAGVVVPCRRAELTPGLDVICARTGTGKVLSGILDDNGVVVVTTGLP